MICSSYYTLRRDRLGRANFPEGLILQDRFRIKHQIAETDLSFVYAADDLRAGTRVAVKQLAPRLDNEDLDLFLVKDRFRRESQLLQHLCLAPLPQHIASFDYEAQPVIVMEYICGFTLDRVLALPQSVGQAVQLGLALCEAVSVLHNQPWPVVHADLKPTNIMVEPMGRIVLLDLGLARVCGPKDYYEEPAGTPRYAPPEQWRGERLDPRSDVFALGMVLRDIYRRLLPDPALDKVFAVATAPRRQDRYHSAIALRRALHVVAARRWLQD